MDPIRILLVDDQKLFRQSLARVLELQNPKFKIIAQASNGEEGWRYAQKYQPDVILMDVRMPVMDGVKCARRVRQECPSARIIMLTTFSDDEYVFEALQLGAAGYLLKDIPPEEVEAAILCVVNGGVLMAPDVASKVFNKLTALQRTELSSGDSPVRKILTRREFDILRLVALGEDNHEIAKKLCISEGTVRNHVCSIYDKLNLRDRAQAVKYAVDNGVI